MKRWIWVVVLIGAFAALGLAAAKKKQTAKSKRAVQAPRVTAEQRAAARDEIAKHIAGDELRVENPEALAGFYEALRKLPAKPVHILQFGDSHTASDDWVQAMRIPLQAKYGDGGPGFVQAGRPYKGYRRFDARGNSSAGWLTEGTMAIRGDADQGLSGVSISTRLAGQTVSLSAAGELLTVFYLQQPGGGSLELTESNLVVGTIATAGEAGPGMASFTLLPGSHELLLRTLDHAPARLFGWSVENTSGLTFETLGINGAQANVMLGWNEQLWATAVKARNPSLLILAYGTNEANSPRWTAGQYRADLTAVIEKVRRAAPDAGLLMVGPPDCGKTHPLTYLSQVVAMQREVARELHVGFWDWRQHMGGAVSIRRWVTAGYAQADYIHMTGEGYRMVGEMIVTSLLEKHDEQARENH